MSSPPLARRLGGLDTLVVPGSADGLIIVMFHGFGADASDLAPLAEVVPTPAGTTWLFPNAPIQVPLGPHMVGRAWFPIDMVEMQAAIVAGRHRDLSTQTPPALAQSQQMATQMLIDYNAPLNRVVFAGFSQGAMLATAMTLQAPEQPAGLVILSGTLLDEQNWRRFAPQRRGLRFMQSHGQRDPLLDVVAARKLQQLLLDAGLDGQLHEFRGEHEIPPAVLREMASYLQRIHDGLPVVH